MPPAAGARSRTTRASAAAARPCSPRGWGRRDGQAMGYVALGLIGLFLVFLLLRAFVGANPATLARSLYWGAAVVFGIVLVILAFTERLAPLLAVAGAVVPVILRGPSLWNRLRGAM